MRTTRPIVACVLGAFLLTSSFALAQGRGNGHGKGHGKQGDDDDQGQYYKDQTVKLFADGMTNTRAAFHPDLPREISCLLDWKNNLCGAARSRQDSRNDSNPVPKTLSDGYLRHLPIARTC